MAYQTGVVNDLTDIQTAIRLFLQANGWTWSGGGTPILYKDQMFVEFITPTADKVLFQAKTALTGGTNAPHQIGMGRMIHSGTGNVPALITFPASYWAFLDNDEFYFILNYDVTRYQFVTWGKSMLDVGPTATGMFISGTVNNHSIYETLVGLGCGISISQSSGGTTGWFGRRAGAPLWQTLATVSNGINLNCDYVHTDLGGASWDLSDGGTNGRGWVGASSFGNLMTVLPNVWNSESPLLPMRAYKRMAESKNSLVLDLKNARFCRIDNFVDQEVVTIGPDEWQIFPFHRRNVSSRDGGADVDHTGTFGWAIRKIA